MSPRAAWRLDRFGCVDVRDLDGGKADWLSRGYPYEGDADLVSRHLVPASTCAVGERVGDVVARVGPNETCVVVADGLAVGVVPPDADRGRRVEDEMLFGMSTVRPMMEVSELRDRMQHHRIATTVVTDGSGHLLGLFRAPLA